MHYLIVGKEGRDKKLTSFLDMLAANVPVETAFSKAFETTFEAMEKELRDYVKQDRYNIVKGQFRTKIELDTNAEAKPLTEAEAQAYLGDLLLHSNRAESVTYLEKALQLDPNLGMAHASMGMLRFRQGKTDEARASLERAIAANSQNYLAHYYYAFTLSRRHPEDSQSRFTPEQTARIREHLKRATELRPDFPESYSLLAFVSLITGSEIDESIASIRRVLSESPGRDDFRFMLGQLYMRKNDYGTARQLLEQVAKSDDEMKQPAQMMLDQLNRLEKQDVQYGDPKTNPSGLRTTSSMTPPNVIAGETLVVETSDPSSALREVLRKPAEGETQIMATLVRIECDVKNIVFVLQTSSGLLRLRTNSFDDIEITTFTADVKGEITCGPRKPANVVVICYLPNTDKRVKADGVLKSVEFVPTDFKLKPDKS